MRQNERGNILLYILIAVVLFAALMFMVTGSSTQEDATSDLTEGKTKIAANEIISYAASASNAIVQMENSGAMPADIDFMLPSNGSFNTAPTIYKLFHPDGGGLNYKPLPISAINDNGSGLAAGYYIGRFNSFAWTPSATNDIVFTAYEINQDVCTALNLKTSGSTTIPTVSGITLDNALVAASLHGGSNANFTTTHCASCDEKPALCVTDGAGKYVFYSLLEAE